KTAIDRRRRSRVGKFSFGIRLVVGRFRVGPGGDDLITERAFDCGVEAAIRAIESLLPWNLNVIAQAEIQGEARIDLPVVLQMEAVEGGGRRVGVFVVSVPACRVVGPACRGTEQE